MGNPIVLTFTEKEIQTLTRIDLDTDQEEALLFIRNVIIRKLKDIIRPHCVPVFEVTYSPKQKEAFQIKEEKKEK